MVSGVPERSAISERESRGAGRRRRRRGWPARARSPTAPGCRCDRPCRPPFRQWKSRLGQRSPRPYRPGMTGTTSASGLHLPRYLREPAELRTPVGFADYKSTALRAPLRTPVDLPQRLTEITGPVLGEDRVTAQDADLTLRNGGEAVGQRILVFGRVLDSDGRPVPDALVEVWQANAAGRYRHVVDTWPGAAGPALRRARPRRHRQPRPLRVHDHQARRLPVGQPPQRVAPRAHPLQPVRAGLHPAAGHADVLPGRPAVRAGPDLQRHPGRGAAPGDQPVLPRAHAGQLGAGLPSGTSCSAARTRRPSRPTTTEMSRDATPWTSRPITEPPTSPAPGSAAPAS